MSWRNTDNNYGRISKIFHWLLFLLIVMMIVGALSTEDMPKGPEKADLIQIHKSLGATILLLVCLRLFWRLVNPVPQAPADAPRWQRTLALLNHYGLYLLMLAQPLSGILMAQAEGHQVAPFHWFTLPQLVAPDQARAEFYGTLHGSLWIALATLAALHVVAAFYHHWLRRDDVLRRMIAS
jgi:cytochrome b561